MSIATPSLSSYRVSVVKSGPTLATDMATETPAGSKVCALGDFTRCVVDMGMGS